jgi:hypothetical protein
MVTQFCKAAEDIFIGNLWNDQPLDLPNMSGFPKEGEPGDLDSLVRAITIAKERFTLE